MKRQIFLGAIIAVFFSAAASAGLMTEIIYEVSPLDSGRWQYTYDVHNISLTEQIKEFTIWFDYGLYDNLAVETPDPPAGDWDEIVVQREPLLQDDGFYDALALSYGIPEGQTVSGFSVSFDWLGDAVMPGSQFYKIIDPVTFKTIDSGYTIPEPATLLLLGLGSLALQVKRKT